MKIRTFIAGICLVGTVLTGISCERQNEKDTKKSRENLLEEVMQNNRKSELDSINAGFSRGNAQVAEMQHKIDSIAFSNFFKGSQQAKDSNFVSDYNKMMAITKTPVEHDGAYGRLSIDNSKIVKYGELDKKLHDVLTVKEIKNIEKNPLWNEGGLYDIGKTKYFGVGKQYLVDSVYHHKLFEKHKLLNDSTAKMFKKICTKVRP